MCRLQVCHYHTFLDRAPNNLKVLILSSIIPIWQKQKLSLSHGDNLALRQQGRAWHHKSKVPGSQPLPFRSNAVRSSWVIHFFFNRFIYLFTSEREKESVARAHEQGGEAEGEADSPLSREPD